MTFQLEDNHTFVVQRNGETVIIEMMPDGRMTALNAAKYIGCSERTLANKRSNGTGPKYYKQYRAYYYRPDIDEWLQANGATSTEQVNANRHVNSRKSTQSFNDN